MDRLVQHQQTINDQLARYGVKFGLYKNGMFQERLFPFDPLPRVITAQEFETLDKGLVQRVNALNGWRSHCRTAGGAMTPLFPVRQGKTMCGSLWAEMLRTAVQSGAFSGGWQSRPCARRCGWMSAAVDLMTEEKAMEPGFCTAPAEAFFI